MQATVAAGRVNDSFEDEADRVAEGVTATSSTFQAGPNNPDTAPVVTRPRAIAGGSDGREAELGPGAPLERSVRDYMEPRFGHDFSGVRVHTGAEADRSARSFGALAYTRGQNVVFMGGRYAPGTRDGQRLLAHELTHTLQQRALGNVSSPQLKAAATRFQDEPTLEEISDGTKVLKQGDKGEAVIRITTALSELGFYGTTFIDENFGSRLFASVTKYQSAKGLKGVVPAGTVEKQTFDKLDQEFSGDFRVERDVIAKQKSPDILKQTQIVGPVERAASERAISTETPVNPATGLPPVFQPDIAGKGKYGDRIRTAVDKEIVSEWTAMGKGKTAEHATAGKLFDAPAVDSIAVEAQKAVTAVFGEYVAGRTLPTLTLGVNVDDAWKKKEDTLTAGGKPAEDSAVEWRVQKILDGDPVVKSIDHEHGAIQSRGPEQAIVAPIKTDMIAKYRPKLLETHKAWPGFEQGGVSYVQLFKGANADEERSNRWQLFQTLIHEYIHALEHPDHVTYREGKGEQKGGFTLREGTTDYFTKIVWSSLTIDDALRAKIEGPVNDPTNKFPIQSLSTYDEAENAERLAGVVGIRNEAAAFFLGKVSLIGKT